MKNLDLQSQKTGPLRPTPEILSKGNKNPVMNSFPRKTTLRPSPYSGRFPVLTMGSTSGEANHCRVLPPQKVTDLLDLVVISGKGLFSTRSTSEGHLFSLERQNDRSFLCFDVDEAKVWKAKKSRDKLCLHLVSPPCCHLAMSTRKN